MRRLLPALIAAAAVAGCAEEPPPPPFAPDDPVPLGSPPSGPRVLVVNGLSETLSMLDLSTGTMHVQAAVTGAWTNRITASPDERLLLVTDSGDNEVALLDGGTLATLDRIDVGNARNPWMARSIDEDRALVSNWLAAEVRLLDVRAGQAGVAIPTTPGPEGFALLGNRAFVACTNYQGAQGAYGEGRLDVVDLAALRVEASLRVGPNPQDVAVAPDGRVHVLCTGDYSGAGAEGQVHVVDPVLRIVADTLALGGSPGRFAVGPDGAMWVVGYAGGLRRYDPASLEVLGDAIDPSLPTSGLSAIAFDDVANRAYVAVFDADLLVAIDASSRVVTEVWLVGDGPVDVLVQRPAAGSATGARRTAKPRTRGRPARRDCGSCLPCP